jgi:hypothetical protein
MLREPEPEIRQVFEWLGGGDVDRANEIIDRELNTQRISPTDPVSSALAPDLAALCDEIHDRADAQRGLTPELVERMNAWQETMVERWGEPSRDRAREDVDLTAAPPGDDADGDATG